MLSLQVAKARVTELEAKVLALEHLLKGIQVRESKQASYLTEHAQRYDGVHETPF